MTSTRILLLAAFVAATPAYAQQDGTVTQAGTARDSTAAVTDTQPEKKSATKAVRYYTPAIEIQHMSHVILERVNRFFGWRAVKRIFAHGRRGRNGVRPQDARCVKPSKPIDHSRGQKRRREADVASRAVTTIRLQR